MLAHRTWSRYGQTDCRLFRRRRHAGRCWQLAFPHGRRRPYEGPAAYAAMLEIRPVVCPHRRAAAVRSAATVRYKRITADRAGTRYTMCCCFRTAPTTFTWTSRGRQGEVSHRYCWRLMPRDGRAWTSCCAATGCSSSHTFSTPVRKWNSSGQTICGLIRTVSALDAVLANDGDRAGRRMLNFMHMIIVMRAIERDKCILL